MELPEYTQETGLYIIERGPENPLVDSIAVHGLAANPAYTWIKKVPNDISNGVGRLNEKGDREVVWLKHLLPGVVANARILKYNYDSRWLANAPKENLRSIGDRLVRMIHLKRKEECSSERPLLFIGHSFGGIVIEEALVHAYRSEEHRSIPLNTCGIVFLGTPFRGSGASSWGATIANCAAVLGLSSESRLLETLKEDSERLELLLNDFTVMAKLVGMKLVCFYEVYEIRLGSFGVGIKTLVVEKRSATIDGYHPISLQVDHSGMNKFGSSENESFKLVAAEIKNLVDWAPDFVYRAGIAGSRQKYIMLPYPRNENYISREVPYNRLSTLMKRPEDSQVRIAIRGLGGIGKTQLALKMAYDSKPTSSVFWVHGATPEHFISNYMDIARKVGLVVDGQKQSDAEICNAVKEWLDSDNSGQWLLIIDNADDLATTLLEYFHTTLPVLRGTLLFTTRNANIVEENLVLPQYEVDLETMTEAESMATFLAISGMEGNEQHDQVHTLLDILGHLPLAIAQSAAYIRQMRISVDTYTKRLQASDEMQSKLLSTPPKKYKLYGDVPQSVMNTWEVSFKHIETVYAASGVLLQILSLLDFQGIPRSLLEAPMIRARLGIADEIDFEIVLQPLLSFSLVNISMESMSQQIHYSMHRLVSLSTRVRMGLKNELVPFTLDLVAKEFPEPSHANLKSCEVYLPQATAILSHTASLRTLDSRRTDLQYIIANLHLAASNLEKAAELFASCYDFNSVTLGNDHEATLNAVNGIASVFDEQGRYAEAIQWFERALIGKEKAYGREHPSTLTTVHSMASVFDNQGRYEEALQWYQRALTGSEKVLGKNHPSTLTAVHNMASVFDKLGQYEKALQWYERVLAWEENALGKGHPDTLTTVHNMALVFNRQGRYEEALQRYQHVLVGWEKALGKDHPSTLTAVHNLASVIDKQGRYEEAWQWYRRALAGWEKALGKDHPCTLTTVHYMAFVIVKQGRYAEALRWYERALAGQEKALGRDHPSTLTTVHCMASVFDKQGRYEEALQWYGLALAGSEKSLGTDHPSTLGTVHNMAVVFKNQGRHEKALHWYERALAGRNNAFGKDHPETLTTVTNMASVFDKQGRYEVALQWYDRALAGQVKALGNDHPFTLTIVHNIAFVYNNQGRYDEALQWYERALAGREKALGGDHPDTLDTAYNIKVALENSLSRSHRCCIG